MYLWLANSVFLILLLLFSGESWGQSKSPHAPVLEAGPTQSFEKKEKFLKGPIEQPSHDTIELPALEKRDESRLGSETEDIQKQSSKIKKKVKDTGVKSDSLQGSRLGKDMLDIKFKSELSPYDANSGNSLESSQQLSGQGKLMESITESLAKREVDDGEDDDYEDEEMKNKVVELLKKYNNIEEIPLSILNEDPEIKENLETYLEKIKR